MATFRDLLLTLQNLSDEQLRQEIKIIPTGYCSEAPVEIDGFSHFSGKVELASSLETGEVLYPKASVLLGPGLPYIRISNLHD